MFFYSFISHLKFTLKRKQYDIFMGDIKLSIQNYDEGDEFFYYRSIPQFQEYIVISQDQYYVMQFNKTQEGKWLLSEYTGVNSSLSLSSVEFQISFPELYENVIFDKSSN